MRKTLGKKQKTEKIQSIFYCINMKGDMPRALCLTF